MLTDGRGSPYIRDKWNNVVRDGKCSLAFHLFAGRASESSARLRQRGGGEEEDIPSGRLRACGKR